MTSGVENEELKSFITSTLAAITSGTENGSGFHLSSSVKFDVAVTVTNASEAGGGLRLHVANAGAKLATQNASVSRIAFEVAKNLNTSSREINYSNKGIV